MTNTSVISSSDRYTAIFCILWFTEDYWQKTLAYIYAWLYLMIEALVRPNISLDFLNAWDEAALLSNLWKEKQTREHSIIFLS